MTNTTSSLSPFPAGSPTIASPRGTFRSKKEKSSSPSERSVISEEGGNNDKSFVSSTHTSSPPSKSNLESSFPVPSGFTISFANKKQRRNSNTITTTSNRRSPMPQTMSLKLEDTSSFVTSQGSIDEDSSSLGLSLISSCNTTNLLTQQLAFREDLDKTEQLKKIKEHHAQLHTATVSSWRDDACFNTKIMKGCSLSDKLVKIAGTKVEMQLPLIIDRIAFNQEVKDFRWRVKSLILTAHFHHKQSCPKSSQISSNGSTPSQSPRSSPSISRRTHRHQAHVEQARKTSPDHSSTACSCREIVPGLCIGDEKLARMLCRDIETIFSAHLTRHPNGIVVGAASALEAGLRQITDLRLFRLTATEEKGEKKKKAAV